MKEIIKPILDAFKKSKAKYIRIDLGWRKYLEFEKKNELEGQEISQTIQSYTHHSAVTEGAVIDKTDDGLFKVMSSYVGKFKYGKHPLVLDMPVKKNQILGFVESMGIAHEIVSPINGSIVEMNIENDGIVEYEQVLLKIKEEM
ncbi:MAG TPA: hypothetical protein DHW82_09480 [Spirochaetia bacterium]|nr:MAG: hypothetical protein A2Y41_05430 [Spirochaetes bacterium GWB1_36_13]HCL57221.1 hypothetical protein [Spirochaetia bacterium]